MSVISVKSLVAVGFLGSAVVTGCVSQSKYNQLEAENTQLRQQVTTQQQQVATQQQQIEAGQAQVSRLQGAIKYTVNSDLLFPTGSWEMSDAGKTIISKMATKLAPTQQNKLVVNGYTDDAPIGPDLEKQGITSNQALSEKRADAVKKFLISQGVDASLVEARGHGEASPVATNDTAEGRAKNRRVELSLGT
jgi:chemotaxis protein MotB